MACPKDVFVTEVSAQAYDIRNGSEWAHVALIMKDKSVNVMINSSFGAYGYYWSNTGKNPKSFLCSIDMNYGMEKLTGYNLYEQDISGYAEHVKQRIIEARIHGYIDSYNARKAWDEMLDIIEEGVTAEQILGELYMHRFFSDVFGDSESLPNCKRVRIACESFWIKLWKPFTDELRKEL